MGLSFSIGREVVFPAICADIAHPEHARNASDGGASVYAAGVMITPKGYDNDAGLLRGYAKRHRVIVLLSNYASETGGYPSAGRSAAWDKYGNLLVEASDQGEAVVLVKIDDDVSGKVLVL
jgi:predicted amidohydrolase